MEDNLFFAVACCFVFFAVVDALKNESFLVQGLAVVAVSLLIRNKMGDSKKGKKTHASKSVAARKGEMTPNPRRRKEEEEEKGEERHGQPSFQHVKRRSSESHDRLRKALFEESIASGFRP